MKLATSKKQVLEFKELEKAKVAAQTAKEVVETSKQVSYNLEVEETEVQLVEKLAEVYRDYCKKVWIEALNLAGVPVASKWRQAGNVFYPPDIRKVPNCTPTFIYPCASLFWATPYHPGLSFSFRGFQRIWPS